MFAQALARRLSRAGIHYGWATVAIIFLPGADHCRLHGHLRRADRSADQGIRLEHRADIGRAGAADRPVRPDGALHGGADRQIRLQERGAGGPGADRDRAHRRAGHDQALASHAVLGRHRRPRHGLDRDGARGARGDPLVYRPPRPRGRDPQRVERLRPASAAAGRGVARRSLWLADRARAADRRPPDRRCPRRLLSRRPARGRRPQALWRQR